MAHGSSTRWRFLVLLVILGNVVALPVAFAGAASGLPIDRKIEQARDRLGGVRERANHALREAGREANPGRVGVGEGVNGAVGQVKGQVNDAVDQVKGRVNDAVGQVKGRVNDAVDQVKGQVNGAVDQVKGRAHEVPTDDLGPVFRSLVIGAAEGLAGSFGGDRAAGPQRGGGAAADVAGSGSMGAGGETTASEGDVDELAQGGNEIAPGSHGGQNARSGLSLSPPPGGQNSWLGFTGRGMLLAMALALILGFTGASLLAADLRRAGLARAAAAVG